MRKRLELRLIHGEQRAESRPARRTRRPSVTPKRRDQQDDRERIHRDALVPAQLARREVGDLGEVQAAERRHQRDQPGQPQAGRRTSSINAATAPHRRHRATIATTRPSPSRGHTRQRQQREEHREIGSTHRNRSLDIRSPARGPACVTARARLRSDGEEPGGAEQTSGSRRPSRGAERNHARRHTLRTSSATPAAPPSTAATVIPVTSAATLRHTPRPDTGIRRRMPRRGDSRRASVARMSTTGRVLTPVR